eukprot:22879_3
MSVYGGLERISLAKPKSATLTMSLLISMFSGLMSLWKNPCLCIYAIPFSCWYIRDLILDSGRSFSLSLVSWYKLWSMNSKTKNNSSFSRMTSLSLMMFGFSLRSDLTSRRSTHSCQLNFLFIFLMALV